MSGVERASETLKVRCRPGELGRWREAAEAAGLGLSAWLRRAAGEQADLEGALGREDALWRERLEAAEVRRRGAA